MYPWYPRDTAEVQVCAAGPQSSGSPTSATSPAIKSESGSAYGDCMDYALHAKVSDVRFFLIPVCKLHNTLIYLSRLTSAINACHRFDGVHDDLRFLRCKTMVVMSSINVVGRYFEISCRDYECEITRRYSGVQNE